MQKYQHHQSCRNSILYLFLLLLHFLEMFCPPYWGILSLVNDWRCTLVSVGLRDISWDILSIQQIGKCSDSTLLIILNEYILSNVKRFTEVEKVIISLVLFQFTFYMAVVKCSEETDLGLHSIDLPISYVWLEPLQGLCSFNSVWHSWWYHMTFSDQR